MRWTARTRSAPAAALNAYSVTTESFCNSPTPHCVASAVNGDSQVKASPSASFSGTSRSLARFSPRDSPALWMSLLHGVDLAFARSSRFLRKSSQVLVAVEINTNLAEASSCTTRLRVLKAGRCLCSHARGSSLLADTPPRLLASGSTQPKLARNARRRLARSERCRSRR